MTLRNIAIRGAGVGTAVGLFLMGAVAKAADYSASTTAGIQSGIDAFLAPFFANLGLIIGAVAAVIITLWGIRWVMSHFRGGKK